MTNTCRHWAGMPYALVVHDCAYSRLTLSHLLEPLSQGPVQALSLAAAESKLATPAGLGAVSHLVIRLPSTSSTLGSALEGLLQLQRLLPGADSPWGWVRPRVVVLTDLPADWLLGTLRQLSPCGDWAGRVWCLPERVTLPRLRSVLGHGRDDALLLYQAQRHFPRTQYGILTTSEVQVLRDMLYGAIPLARQAELRHLNIKTLHAQSLSARYKLACPSLASLWRWRPGRGSTAMRRRLQKREGKDGTETRDE